MPFEIIPHLFLGNANDAIHASIDVKLVVNCTKELPFYSPDTQHIRIAVDDNGNETAEIGKHWTPELFYTISNHIMQGHDVLIHCHMGRQRSAATVAAFMMYSLGWPLEKTISFIRDRKRDAFFPGVNFIEALNKLSKIGE